VRRGTAGVVNRKRFARSRMSRLRGVPENKLRDRNGIGAGSRQGRYMQGLANVAGGVAAAVFVFVEICAAGRKVEKSNPSQQCQRAACGDFAENVLCETHPKLQTTLHTPPCFLRRCFCKTVASQQPRPESLYLGDSYCITFVLRYIRTVSYH